MLVCPPVCMRVPGELTGNSIFPHQLSAEGALTHYLSLTRCKVETNSQRQTHTHADLRSHKVGTMMRHSAMVRTLLVD